VVGLGEVVKIKETEFQSELDVKVRNEEFTG
jgi:hypothetical protein